MQSIVLLPCILLAMRTFSQLKIIDALGPFVEQQTKTDTINWSKISFANLETRGRLPLAMREHLVKRFVVYIEQVSALGYNAISIDDLAHLSLFAFYSPSLATLVKDYQALYKQLFLAAKRKHMKIFINTDYLFTNELIQTHMKLSRLTPEDIFCTALDQMNERFPEVDGIILRVGENDGKDVTGDFRSKLYLRTPNEANKLLKRILPTFEKHNKILIFRTWSVGVYRIGDLIWNQKTFDAVFSDIESSALIISMKYGDTDFMRYLSLNPLFLRATTHKKILELQTRREWEGMGLYPSFVGWDYADYLNQLAEREDFAGIHVWCQTGGWAKSAWTNLSYLENSSFWNELNTEVTIDIANGYDVESAIARFCQKRQINNSGKFTELLRLSEIAIKKGLYLPDFAGQSLYFRRSRIPPLMGFTWDRVLLHSFMQSLYRHTLTQKQIHTAINDSYEAIAATDKMIDIAQKIKLSPDVLASLCFERETLIIFSQLRKYLLGNMRERSISQLNHAIQSYEKKYPQHYSIPHLSYRKPPKQISRSLLKLLVRTRSAYRKIDITLLKTSPVQARIIRYYLRRTRSHLLEQSMGVESLFK